MATQYGSVIKIVRYVTADGEDRFDAWLRLQSAEIRARVQTRLDRVELGNFGDHRGVGQGVFELRVDRGPGYRIYYGRDGDDLVILLAGGTKKRQTRDIETAHTLWKAYRQEKRHARQGP